MIIDEEKVEDYEKKYKDMIFEQIRDASSQQTENIRLMTKGARILGQSNVDIPNACITVNNKLVELNQVFKKAGLSLFSSELEKYDLVVPSFLGNAVIQDLMDELTQANNKLEEYGKIIQDVSKEKSEQLLELKNVGHIRKFFAKLRSFFVPTQPIDISLNDQEKTILNNSLQDYIDADDKIWKYALEDRIIQAIVKKITSPQKIGEIEMKHCYDATLVPSLLEESVIPDLKKLRLENLIPQLQEALIAEYKKDLPETEIYQIPDEQMHLYVPDFSKTTGEIQTMTEEEIEAKMQEINEDSTKIIKESKRGLRSIKADKTIGGIGIKNFEVVDANVSASQRRDATNTISRELSNEQAQTQSHTPIKEDEAEDISIK